MTDQSSTIKPLVGIVLAAVVLIGAGYVLTISSVTGVQVVDPNVALGGVVVLFFLTGGWLLTQSRKE